MTQFDRPGYVVSNSSIEADKMARHNQATIHVVVGSILTIWIIGINTILLCAILMTRSLRQRSSNWLLVNLACADLLVGLLVTSFTSYQRGHDLQWELSHHVCVFWLLLDILLCCVSMYMLIAINIDRCIFITFPSQYLRKMRRPVIIFLMVSSWVVAMCIVMPFFFKGRTDGFSIKDNINVSEMCYIELLPRYSIASSVLSYFIPGAVLIVITGLTFRAALMKIRDHQRRLAASNSSTSDCGTSSGEEDNTAIGHIKKAVFVVCVINAVYLVMWLPFFFINILSAADMYHALSPEAFDVAIWLAYANSGINPLVWLLYGDIRRAVVNVLHCRFDKKRHGLYLNDDDEEETENVPITSAPDA